MSAVAPIRWKGRVCLVLLIVALGAATAAGQSFDVAHVFHPPGRHPSGKLLEVAPGYLLGTSQRGGAHDNGSIYLLYRKPDSSWATVVVHSFVGPEGTRPAAGVIFGSDGNFYGTATQGGAHDQGTVFKMTPSGRVTVLHSFSGSDGAAPSEALVEAADGSLWSTTDHGGVALPNYGFGTIFKITKGGMLTTVHAFNVNDGQYPNALVAGPEGFFYGSTLAGGPDSGTFRSGTIFRISLTGTLTTLHSFVHDFAPSDLTLGSDGHLYGTSVRGWFDGPDVPADGRGVVFRVTRTGTLTALRYFVADDGFWSPSGGVIQGPDGALYGGTLERTNGSSPLAGSLYRLTLDGTLNKLADLGEPMGVEPSGLMVARDGTIYGTTRTGGYELFGNHEGFGAAFTINVPDQARLLYSFSDPTPLHPTGRLTEASDGSLYGTSCAGGVFNRGTIYRYRDGIVETVHSFNGHDGLCPFGGVTFGPDGLLYGTTFLGGSGGFSFGGTVFRSTTDGAFSVLWNASEEPGRFPMSAPTVGPDGHLYVTASSIYSGIVGPADPGAILRISTTGTVTVAAIFDESAGYGIKPLSPLLFASDGYAYGTTSYGAGSGVYRMTLEGTLSSVASMSGPGSTLSLRGGLVEGAPGILYGADGAGGSTGLGALFSASTAGATATLHDFVGVDGVRPFGDLVNAGAGRFIGVTAGFKNGAQQQFGTIFQITTDTRFQTLHRFSWSDGSNPTGLMRTAAGEFFGTALQGGAGAGLIFRVSPP